MTPSNVPFFSNTSDNTHCFQAALRMVLKHFQPEKEYSWEELDIITVKVTGLWTWPMAGLIWLKKNGYDVKDVEIFDYEQFVQKGGQYLIEFFGKDVGESQIAHSEINQEIGFSKIFLEEIRPEKRLPSTDEIKSLLNDDYLVVCNVNSRVLNDKEGYAGHFVVITDMDKNELTLHDPGLPPNKNWRVSTEAFERAWAYPDEGAKNLMAFKRKLAKHLPRGSAAGFHVGKSENPRFSG